MAAVKTGHEQGLPVSQGSPGLRLQCDLRDLSTLLAASVFDLNNEGEDEGSFRLRGRSGLYFYSTASQEPGTSPFTALFVSSCEYEHCVRCVSVILT